MFHKHKWIEIERFYAAPYRGGALTQCDRETFQKLRLGVTTIRYDCHSCPAVQYVEILGKSIKEPSPNEDHQTQN
jgi:hypothetical protein